MERKLLKQQGDAVRIDVGCPKMHKRDKAHSPRMLGPLANENSCTYHFRPLAVPPAKAEYMHGLKLGF